MNLLTYKWTTAIIILAISVVTGFISLRFVTKYRRQLQIGDAAANGIFIGAALFHLIPDSRIALIFAGFNSALITVVMLVVLSFIVLFLIDRGAYKIKEKNEQFFSAWVLTITLSIHALITGIALGLSESTIMVSIIFFAIIAHKGFEMFAFVFQLHRRWEHHRSVMIVILLFSLVTPLGIWLGSVSNRFFEISTNNILTGIFDAFAAGTFLYIGTAHRHHRDYHTSQDSHHHYNEVLAMITGVAVMGVVGFFT